MKKLSLIIASLLCSLMGFSQKTDTLRVNYFSHSPFSFNENTGEKGIEIDIINEYITWLKTKKHINLVIKYQSYFEWTDFFNATKKAGKNTIGLGSVTINADRSKEIDFTAAYLKNVAFCITNGNAPVIKSKTPDEIVRTLGGMTALTISNTTYSDYIGELKKNYIQDLKVVYESNETQILDEISKNVLSFGYLEAALTQSEAHHLAHGDRIVNNQHLSHAYISLLID